ncbi:MAG: sugar dehydratase, partial [bacterium]|nr:sugar dehydratase [bacterium]
DLNFNRIVPGTIQSLWHEEHPIVRSNGQLIRDYFYIEDVANAYLTLAENLREKRLEGQAFNFASGEPLTVLQLVAKITELTGKPLPPRILNTATNEIPAQYLSSEKARSVLGWAPQITLEEGLKRTIAWYDDYLARHANRAGG